jgi:hypothetical protein
MARCFVIQPFDNDKFDKRFDDVFSPAIKAADLEPYRVDRDPTANDLLEAIERGMADSAAFLADITLDNPNVWFELGSAMTAGLPFCVCCSEERTSHFPFDVSHLKIIKYKVGSTSDFNDLGKKITERLKAVVSREAKLKSISKSVTALTETEGLAPYEFTAVTILFEYQYESDPGISAPLLQRDMEKAGFTKAATNLALVELLERGFLEQSEVQDRDYGPFLVFKLKKAGLDWLRQNKDQLVLKRASAPATLGGPVTDDDIPF